MLCQWWQKTFRIAVWSYFSSVNHRIDGGISGWKWGDHNLEFLYLWPPIERVKWVDELTSSIYLKIKIIFKIINLGNPDLLVILMTGGSVSLAPFISSFPLFSNHFVHLWQCWVFFISSLVHDEVYTRLMTLSLPSCDRLNKLPLRQCVIGSGTASWK